MNTYMASLVCRNRSCLLKPLVATEAIVRQCVGSFNINNAVKKGDDCVSLCTLVEQHVTTLQGIGPVHTHYTAVLYL
jgi:hypothetical protein